MSGWVALFGAAAAMAQSALLTAGNSFYVPATSADKEKDLAGVVIYDALTPFKITNLVGGVRCAGNLQNRVVRSNLTGKYHFYYRIRDTGGNGSVLGVRVASFAGLPIRVAYRSDGLGAVAPYSVARDAAPGDLVGFAFVSDPGPQGHFKCYEHNDSKFILVKTDATAFHGDGSTRIKADGQNEVTVPTVQP